MSVAGGGPRVRRLAHPDAEIKPRSLRLPRGRPVVAVLGTTGERLATELSSALLPVLRAVLVTAERHGAAVVTAGADTGVAHLVGLAAEAVEGRLPRLVGVAPSGRVAADDAEPSQDEVRLNANHDTAVLVPGARWGEEVPALLRLVEAVAGKRRPALALLVGGDEAARAALVEHLGRDRPLLVLAGTGGLADEIAAGELAEDDDLPVLLRGGQVAVVHLDEGPDRVGAVLRRVLGAKPGASVRADVPPLAVWPRLRFRAPEAQPVVDPGYVLDYPLLADAIHEANQLVAPALHECEVEALRARERGRLLVALAIAAGFATTSFAALQVWLRGVPWPGVLVAVSGALAAVLAVVSRGAGDAEARTRAELLRALYFDHLAAPPAADDAEREQRVRELATAVARHRHEPVSAS
ncbi:hypothetical protein JOF41_004074 [Saccharothrix coeruleofusca]|uniref:hypothetical protein n=1 Tax=Saccharothrix coeruleofusca TaxID=33919 RepID=UPI001AE74D7C|nr:hypothetical protein [Saccharothrix coeruleofusca]MBP2337896.1 hypothetical protein [Saccharothrix coeruleofusca]